MFSVELREERGASFSDSLRAIFNLPLSEREYAVEDDIILRLERLSEDAPVIRGELMRLQGANLPPKALPGHAATRLGVRSIGHSAVFAYDKALSVLALQSARSGITPSRVALYADALHGTAYDIWPILSADAWQKIAHGRIRAARIRLASPEELEAADEHSTAVKQGLRKLKEATETRYLDVSFKMGRGDPDLDRRNTTRLFRWFQGEREAGRGDVKALAATVFNGEKTEILNLIGAQMGADTRLDLPADDPDVSYEMRSQFALQSLRNNHAALRAQFG